MTLRVVVDFDLCEGNGMCVDEAPEVFALNDKDTVDVILPEPPEALRPKVLEAARKCPRCAVKVTG